MRFSDDLLQAYIRGELAEPAHAAVERAMRADPVIAARIHEQRMRHERACGVSANGHGGVHHAQRVNARPTAKVVHLDTRRPGRPLPPPLEPQLPWYRQRLATLGLAVASGAGAGVLLWHVLAPVPSLVRLDKASNMLEARGALIEALDGPPGSPAGLRSGIQVGMTFVDKDGGYCRSFTMRTMAGLACISGGVWKVPVLAQRPPELADEAGMLPAAVHEAIAQRIVGGTLDPAAERAAQQRNWQR